MIPARDVGGPIHCRARYCQGRSVIGGVFRLHQGPNDSLLPGFGGAGEQRWHYLRRRELRADPALNQAICSSFSECLRAASAEEPSR